MVSSFLTHAEVVVDPAVPIGSWGLSLEGRHRAAQAPALAWGPGDRRIVSSTERKAVETAEVLGAAVGTPVHRDPLLGEIDRSATGYLPPAAFDAVVDAFFAEPARSVRGWERAVDAQARIVRAVRRTAPPATSRSSRTAPWAHSSSPTCAGCRSPAPSTSPAWGASSPSTRPPGRPRATGSACRRTDAAERTPGSALHHEQSGRLTPRAAPL